MTDAPTEPSSTPRGPGAPVPRAGPADPGSDLPRIVVLYHRPYEDAFHGGSIHFHGFIEGLRPSFRILPVAPPLLSSWNPSDPASVRMAGLRYLLRSPFDWLQFVVSECRRPRGERVRVVVSFDIYPVALAAVWARIQGVPLVYYPQDSNRDVSKDWARSGYRGGSLFQWVRRPLERVALRSANLVIVPSEVVRASLAREGVPPDRILTCMLKRSMPVLRPEDVERWRAKLHLNGSPVAVFVGSFQYPPNVRAFEFLRSAVVPALKQAGSNLRVIVAGLGSEAFASQSADAVQVVGTVDDLDGLLFASSIGLAPMDVAAGTSGKIVDYVLHGLTALATPEAAQGMPPTPALQVVPLHEFAGALVRLVAQTHPSLVERRVAPVVDPEFVRSYTGDEDMTRVAGEITRLARPVPAGDPRVRRE